MRTKPLQTAQHVHILRHDPGAGLTRAEEGKMEPQIRNVMPPHPGSSIDFEEAVAVWKKIAEEDRQRRLRRNAARRAAYRAQKEAGQPRP